MIVKWTIGGYSDHPIKRVEFKRETKHFYVLEEKDYRGRPTERRESKSNHYHSYHDSWQDAKNYLVAKLEGEISTTTARLEKLREKLAIYKELQPEEGRDD